MQKKYDVTQRVKVQVDESKFTSNFLEVFRECFYDFEDIKDHMEHLAQGCARGFWDNTSFIEGYGKAENMGIIFTLEDTEVKAIDEE